MLVPHLIQVIPTQISKLSHIIVSSSFTTKRIPGACLAVDLLTRATMDGCSDCITTRLTCLCPDSARCIEIVANMCSQVDHADSGI